MDNSPEYWPAPSTLSTDRNNRDWIKVLIHTTERFKDREPATAQMLHQHAVRAADEFAVYFAVITDDLFVTTRFLKPGIRWQGRSECLGVRARLIVSRRDGIPSISLNLEPTETSPKPARCLWSQSVTSLDPIDFGPAVAAWSAWLIRQTPVRAGEQPATEWVHRSAEDFPAAPDWLAPLTESTNRFRDGRVQAERLYRHALESLQEFQYYFSAALDGRLRGGKVPDNREGWIWRGKLARAHVEVGLRIRQFGEKTFIRMEVQTPSKPWRLLWCRDVVSLDDPIDFSPAVEAWSAWLDDVAAHPPQATPRRKLSFGDIYWDWLVPGTFLIYGGMILFLLGYGMIWLVHHFVH